MEHKVENLGVLIQEIVEHTEQRLGNIIIPATANVRSKQKKGKVIGVGKGTKDKPMEVYVGDVVVYKNAEYPKAGDFDVVKLDDILYVI